jgi:hypothetical protein
MDNALRTTIVILTMGWSDFLLIPLAYLDGMLVRCIGENFKDSHSVQFVRTGQNGEEFEAFGPQFRVLRNV